jgi:hypothetical protein
VGNPAIVDGTGVALDFTGNQYLYCVRANTVIRNFVSISALRLEATAVNFVCIDCGFVGKTGNVSTFTLGTPGAYSNLRIARCTFTNPNAASGTPSTSTVGAIVWRPDQASNASITGVVIEDCEFHDFHANVRALISFFGYQTPRAQDFILRRLKFTNYTGLAIDLEVPGPTSDAALSPSGTPGWSAGVVVEDIECENGLVQTFVPDAWTGGAVFISGFGLSPTPGFGPNYVRRIRGKNLTGDAGLVDLLYGTYQGGDLWVDGLHTDNIDGCVLLADIGCYDCRFEGIYARNVTGKTGVINSGAVFLSLQNVTNFTVSGIDADNVKTAVFIGNTGTQFSINIFGMTATNVKSYGVVIAGSAARSDNFKLSNYVLDGQGYSIYCSRTWNGASNGFINGCPQGTLGHTLSGDTRVGIDPQIDPVSRRPLPGSPLIRAAKPTGMRLRDASGRRYNAKASIGAYEPAAVQREPRN